MKNLEQINEADDLSRKMQLLVGAAIVAMTTSLSTHHITVTAHGRPPTVNDISHLMEREREVLHAHTNLGRARYATATSGE